MLLKDFQASVMPLARHSSEHVVKAESPLLPYPYHDLVSRVTSFAVVKAAMVGSKSDSSDVHTVVVSYHRADGDEHFGIWCSDKFIQRGFTEDEADARIAEAVSSLGLPAANANALRLQMKTLWGWGRDSGGCKFWRGWKKPSRELCVHTAHYLEHLPSEFVQDAREYYDSVAAAAATSELAPVRGETLEFEEMAFRVPILYEGDRGSGKTTAARTYARANSLPLIEVGGHEGLEASDLLGYLVRLTADSMVWKDGPLSQAFRQARTTKVVLLLDEMLRIPKRELSVLLTALSPDDGVYRLRTGRILAVEDDVGTEEVLECPVENLCVVGTTNVGSEFAVDEMDPAIAERFVPIRKDTTKADLVAILAKRASTRGFGKAIVDQCVEFYEKMALAKAQGMVSKAPTTRTMSRAIDLADRQNDVKRVLQTQMLLWVARDIDGTPVPEQVTLVKNLLDRIFK